MTLRRVEPRLPLRLFRYVTERAAERIIGKSEISASGIEFYRPLSNAVAALVPSQVDRWRRENPNALRTWTTKYGCVVQFWGMRVYYGNCADCSVLVTTRRDISGSHYRRGQTRIGAWPKYCDDCRRDRAEKHNDRARARMRRVRQERRQVL